MPWGIAAAVAAPLVSQGLSAAFGSGQSTQNVGQSGPTISPQQSSIQTLLAALFPAIASSGATGTPQATGLTTPAQGNILQTLQDLFSPAIAAATSTSPALTNTTRTLTSILGNPFGNIFGTSTPTAGSTVGGTSPTFTGGPNPTSVSDYFQNVIAQPIEQNFTQQVLPALQAAFARSAGGTNSGQGGAGTQPFSGLEPTTGFGGAVNFANQNLDTSLTSAATNFGFNTQQAAIQNALKAAAIQPGVTQAQPPMFSNLINLISSLAGVGTGLGNTGIGNLLQLFQIMSNFSGSPTQAQSLNTIVNPATGPNFSSLTSPQTTSALAGVLQNLFNNPSSATGADSGNLGLT